MNPYVVLLPGRPGNQTDKHLVVHTSEYVEVSLGEKNQYDFLIEHDDYDSAGRDRDRLNRKPPSWTATAPTPPQPTTPPTAGTSLKSSAFWTKPTTTTSSTPTETAGPARATSASTSTPTSTGETVNP